MPHDQDSSSPYGIPHGIWDANTCSWRTSQLSLFGEAQCLTKSPAQGMTLNGQLFQHNPWAHLISDAGGGRSAWPTATVNGNHNYKGASLTSGDGLSTAVKKSEGLWPTATTDMTTMRKKRYAQGGTPLTLAVSQQWPTPTRNSAFQENHKYSQGGTPLTLAVSQAQTWLTPLASDGNKSPSGILSLQIERGGVRGPMPQQRLNPEWVECLMGYPPGWTDINGQQEEESSPSPMSHQESEKEEPEMSQNLQHLETPLFPNALMS